jgi:hypothetical protein
MKRSGVVAGALELVVELVECEGSSGAFGAELAVKCKVKGAIEDCWPG